MIVLPDNMKSSYRDDVQEGYTYYTHHGHSGFIDIVFHGIFFRLRTHPVVYIMRNNRHILRYEAAKTVGKWVNPRKVSVISGVGSTDITEQDLVLYSIEFPFLNLYNIGETIDSIKNLSGE